MPKPTEEQLIVAMLDLKAAMKSYDESSTARDRLARQLEETDRAIEQNQEAVAATRAKLRELMLSAGYQILFCESDVAVMSESGRVTLSTGLKSFTLKENNGS